MATHTRQATATIDDDQDLLVPVHDHKKSHLNVRDIVVIRSSPYYEKSHWLDLKTLEEPYKVFALALQSFSPVTEKYAFDHYQEAFNIHEVIELAKDYSKQLQVDFPKTTLYIIAFRSILYAEVQASTEKRQFLAKVDNDSHIEANVSGGLLKYWFGTPDDIHGQNLATCWWVSKEHAKNGGGGNAHRSGMKAVRSWFEHWHVEEYELVVEKDIKSYNFNRVA